MIKLGEVISPVTNMLPLRNGGCWLQGFDFTERTCVIRQRQSQLLVTDSSRLRGDSTSILLFRINREALAIGNSSDYRFIARASQNLGRRVLKG